MKRASITSVLILLVFIIFPINTFANNFFGIIDYKPSSFVEVADQPFFYSIGMNLRYGRTIDKKSPIIFKGFFRGGKLQNVFVSPDNKKAAIVSGDKLYFADTNGHVYLLLEKADHRFSKYLKEGAVFYSYSSIQWDRDSKSIYINRDIKLKPNPQDQRQSPEASLMRIDIASPTKIIEVIKDFSPWDYFFIGDDAICYNYALKNGDVIWKCSLNGNIREVINNTGEKIFLEGGTIIEGKPFVSYWGNIYESAIWLSNYGFSMRLVDKGIVGFFSKDNNIKPIFKIQGGYNIKGHFVDGVGQEGCKVLPGGRYALLDIYHDNFKGQLLVDGLTGKYRELPAKTKVYLNLNSLNYQNFKFDMGPCEPPKFVPAYDDINRIHK